MGNHVAPPRNYSILLGQYQVSDDTGVVLSTVLGSCISVCLHDEQRRVGGMNHFMLPRSFDALSNNKRYGANAMDVLIDGMLSAGASKKSIKAKVFGGSSMWENMDGIGESNSAFAIDFLNKSEIPCVFSSVGGSLARRLRFHPATGQAQQFLVPNQSLYEEAKLQTAVGSATGCDIRHHRQSS